VDEINRPGRKPTRAFAFGCLSAAVATTSLAQAPNFVLKPALTARRPTTDSRSAGGYSYSSASDCPFNDSLSLKSITAYRRYRRFRQLPQFQSAAEGVGDLVPRDVLATPRAKSFGRQAVAGGLS
jgi:hypothetical protein